MEPLSGPVHGKSQPYLVWTSYLMFVRIAQNTWEIAQSKTIFFLLHFHISHRLSYLELCQQRVVITQLNLHSDVTVQSIALNLDDTEHLHRGMVAILVNVTPKQK